MANFVAHHPSKGWSDTVDHEAHRTFLSWLGCVVGASGHEAADAAPAAVQMLQLASQASVQGRQITGRELIGALVIGIDVSCRVGNAMYPDHYDRGWHTTGSTGTLGAAAGYTRLLNLGAQKSKWRQPSA